MKASTLPQYLPHLLRLPSNVIIECASNSLQAKWWPILTVRRFRLFRSRVLAWYLLLTYSSLGLVAKVLGTYGWLGCIFGVCKDYGISLQQVFVIYYYAISFN